MSEYKTTVSSNARVVRHEEHESHGRVLQKRRTRQALLDAANRLRARGTVPTIEDIAAEAQVSRATIYRYYTAIDALVADALFQADLPEVELFDPTMTTPVDRVLAVERYVNNLLSADEIGLHVIVRNFVDNWLNSDPSDRIRAAEVASGFDAVGWGVRSEGLVHECSDDRREGWGGEADRSGVVAA